jgi:hypothetical protein
MFWEKFPSNFDKILEQINNLATKKYVLKHKCEICHKKKKYSLNL